MRVARPVELSAEQQETLESRARARSAAARSVERARIVLLAATGKNTDDHGGPNPGSDPEDDAGQARQRHTLEHTQHGRGRWA